MREGLLYAKQFSIPYYIIDTKSEKLKIFYQVKLKNTKYLYLFSRLYENNF